MDLQGGGLHLLPPDLPHQGLLGQDLLRGLEEGLQEEEGLGGEGEAPFPAEGLHAPGVEAEVLVGEDLLAPPRPADQGLEAGEELLEAVGLHQVVVGPLPKALHPPLHPVQRGEHEDGDLGALPDRAQKGKPVPLGQEHVHNHHLGPRKKA